MYSNMQIHYIPFLLDLEELTNSTVIVINSISMLLILKFYFFRHFFKINQTYFI
jgi:hypothetical protein